jgi:hypothetical protein
MRTRSAVGLLLAVSLTSSCSGSDRTAPLPTARSRIAFADQKGSTGYLYIVNADGSKRLILKRPHTTLISLAWRADGRAIAWIETPAYHTASDVWIMSADGTRKRVDLVDPGALIDDRLDERRHGDEVALAMRAAAVHAVAFARHAACLQAGEQNCLWLRPVSFAPQRLHVRRNRSRFAASSRCRASLI